ncbi:MAG: hypothetical protein M3033_13350 [Acidobacteriota bacterium]|nr:hypothetical protein [Acidobacteriota bacterium]
MEEDIKKQHGQTNRIIARIATAWQYTVILELSDRLKTLPLRHRAVAIEYIYERCLRYASGRVWKELEKAHVQNDIVENPDKRIEFILLAKYMQSIKYLERIIRQVNMLFSRWLANESININELYQDLFARKPSVGEHAECTGEIIVSGSYYRCR